MPERWRSKCPTPDEALTPPPAWHALLTPLIAHVFHELGVSVALWVTGDWWETVHLVPNVARFELEKGVQAKRWSYNARCFAEVRRTGKTIRGQHAGFSDLFVPVRDRSGVRGVFVAGPFALARPTGAEVLERWYGLTGSQGHLSDPSFAQYLSVTLSTLTLEGSLLEAFEGLMKCFVELVGGGPEPAALHEQAETFRQRLLAARSVDAMWEAVRSMLDERTTDTWSAQDRWRERADLGISKPPEHVVVGLLVGALREIDSVEDRLRRDAFQRACVAWSRRQGHVACGQVGDHGIVFLVDHAGSGPRTRARLIDLATRAAATARRFGFKLHAGISLATAGAGVPVRYRAALVAAEMALSRAQAFVFGERRSGLSPRDLRTLRTELVKSLREHPDQFLLRFEQYVEAVLVRSGYRLEPVRAELDAGLERLAEPLVSSGALDEKSFDDMCAKMDAAAASVENVTALVALYRNLLSDIRRAVESPTIARQDRGTRRAIQFMHEHAGERLTLSHVARAAGFAPDYFSRLFHRAEGITFERYLQQLRVSKAKQMLQGTQLAVDGVSRLCGFTNRAYFHRVFKASLGMTPTEYRERPI